VSVGRESNKFPEWVYKLHEKYGSIISFNIGAQTFVFINDGDKVAQMLGEETFMFRPVDKFPVLKQMIRGDQSIGK